MIFRHDSVEAHVTADEIRRAVGHNDQQEDRSLRLKEAALARADGRSGQTPERANACAALVALAASEAIASSDVRQFLWRLGEAGAGIRPGITGFLDLARAGRNTISGYGFREDLDDGTDSQVRHFCGVAVACDRFGPTLTRWISVHLRRDGTDSPDGRLTEMAIDFVARLQERELAIADAASWLQAELCAPLVIPDGGPHDGPPSRRSRTTPA